MSKCSAIYASDLAVELAAALSSCATYQKCGLHGCPGDADLGKTVQESINQHTGLGAPNSIRVTALDHVVYLNGQVDYGLERSTAESVANQVPGVTKVVNNLYVSH
jgi:osmotically-inducible protein OsmY